MALRSELDFVGGIVILWLGLSYSYWPSFSYPLLDYDDPAYLTSHPLADQSILSGHFWASLFQSSTVNLWHPLTVLSHQLGIRITDDWGWHHFANFIGHGLVATAWAFVLRSLTKKNLLAALLAIIFAWHPLTVESVAWISGRKDILCSLFIVLMVLSHLRWVREKTCLMYASTFFFGIAAMLSKPVAIVAPFLLLTIDYCLLARSLRDSRVLLEKLIWIIPCSLLVILTLHFQGEGNQSVIDSRSLLEKSAGALWAFEHALSSMVWPIGLYLGYRDPTTFSQSHLFFGITITLLTALGLLTLREKHPDLLAGFLLISFTLGPTLGLIRAGNHIGADRYSYLPLLGFTLLLIPVLKSLPRRYLLIFFAFPLVLLWLQRTQVTHWKSLGALFSHTLTFDPENAAAHTQLAQIAETRGDRSDARQHLTTALATEPSHVGANLLLANIAYSDSKWDEAHNHYLTASKTRKNDPQIFQMLARCAAQLGDFSKAKHFQNQSNALPSDRDPRRSP